MLPHFALVLCLLLADPAVFGEDKEEKEQSKPAKTEPRSRDKGSSARLEAWESLSEEQRGKLKQALRDAWTDPAVISAREEVKQASDAYQEAIQAAVNRSDPSLAEVMSKIQRSNSGMAHERIWGRPGREGREGRKGMPSASSRRGGPDKDDAKPRRGFGGQIRPLGYLETLSPKERESFRRAEEAALASETVRTARSELEKVREEGEALRDRRLDAHRKLRKATIEEMIRFDPSIAKLREKLSGDDRGANAPPRKARDKNADSPGPGKKSGSGGSAGDKASPRTE
ncbi:MAG: hypothetical protein GXX91_10280 [Verrucomicrobiaceae bacterium]|nr:hypothetical protein [Verrucomicrobiaceae bacterium]